MIGYTIINTGSKGNAVVINEIIMIDCGVPFRALKEIYKKLKLVLLTHQHGDHFNRPTIRKLAQERPTLRFGCPEWLVPQLLDLVDSRNIDVYRLNDVYFYAERFSVTPFRLTHNVPNCGYKLFTPVGDILYATDTNNMSGVEAENFDLYMLEANYGEQEIVERIRRKEATGEHIHEWDVLQNHLSREKADAWLAINAGPNSRVAYLHKHEERSQGA